MSPRVEFEGALILKLLEDVLFDFLDRALGVNEVVVEYFFERLQGGPRLLFEHAITPLSQAFVVIGGAFLRKLTDTRAPDFLIQIADFSTTLDLTRNALFF